MKRRFAVVLGFAGVIFLQATTPAAAQTPVPAQASPRIVRAAIPPQVTTPTPAAVAQPATAAAPVATSAPTAPVAVAPVAARTPQPWPATTPAPAVAAQPPTAVAPVAMSTPQATPPVPPQAKPGQATPTPRPPAEPAPAPKSLLDYEAANVKIEVTITYQVGNGVPVKRMATLTVADQGRGSLRAGNQVAVPSTTFQPLAAGGPATSPITSVNYKSVGLNVDANRVYIQGNKTRMDLNVEFSAVDEKGSDAKAGYPSFPTFSQSLTLVLESGKPVIVGQSSDVVDNVERRQTVEVKATILR
jgi:hypothetical protein